MISMRDRIMGYLEYINITWPTTYPGLTIEYGCENYGTLSIYVIATYDGFSIRRVFDVGSPNMPDDNTYFKCITNSLQHLRDKVMEKGEEQERRNTRTMARICYNSYLPLFTLPKPEKIILNDPATIILWSDNTKTIVKKNSKDKKFDPEKGIALCYMKKALGNKGNYNNVFKEWIK